MTSKRQLIKPASLILTWLQGMFHTINMDVILKYNSLQGSKYPQSILTKKKVHS
jgi:hypothetical protein